MMTSLPRFLLLFLLLGALCLGFQATSLVPGRSDSDFCQPGKIHGSFKNFSLFCPHHCGAAYDPYHSARLYVGFGTKTEGTLT